MKKLKVFKAAFSKNWIQREGKYNLLNGTAFSLYTLFAIILLFVPAEFSTNNSAAYANYGLGLVGALCVAIGWEFRQSVKGEKPNVWEILFTIIGSPIGATLGLFYLLADWPVWGLPIVASIIFGYSIAKSRFKK